MKLKISTSVISLIGVLFLCSCFRLREPIAPNTNSSEWVSPTEINILLENLKRSIATLNVNNYERCLTGAKFKFIPEPGIAGNSQGVFNRWTNIEEREYFNNIKAKSVPNLNNVFQYTIQRTQTYTVDSVELNLIYQLRVNHQDTAFNNINFEGLMRVILVRNTNNEWAITEWQDNLIDNKPCWTLLKRRFISL